jgi:hypothetical protein
MLNGTQYFSIYHSATGEKIYVEQQFSEKERIMLDDLSMLSGMEMHYSNMQNFIDAGEQSREENGFPANPQNQTILRQGLQSIGDTTQRLLDNMLQTYVQYDIDLEEANDFMRKVSMGEFDLMGLLAKHF